MPFGTDCDSRKGSGRNRGLDYRQNVEHVSAARGITNGKAYRTQIAAETAPDPDAGAYRRPDDCYDEFDGCDR